MGDIPHSKHSILGPLIVTVTSYCKIQSFKLQKVPIFLICSHTIQKSKVSSGTQYNLTVNFYKIKTEIKPYTYTRIRTNIPIPKREELEGSKEILNQSKMKSIHGKYHVLQICIKHLRLMLASTGLDFPIFSVLPAYGTKNIFSLRFAPLCPSRFPQVSQG